MSKTKTQAVAVGTKKFASPAPSTSIEAQGVLDKPEDIFRELGVNRALLKLREYVPALANKTIELRTYDQMIRSDAQVRAIIRACKVPVLAGQWFVEPGSDDPIDQEVAEFVQFNLDNMSITWSQFLEEALHFIEYGFSVFEQVFTSKVWAPLGDNRKSRQYAMLKKLAPRPQQSISRFVYDDNGGPSGAVHIKTDPNREMLNLVTGAPTLPFPSKSVSADQALLIPIEKLLVFTFDKTGGDLMGLSLLRSVYQHWYIKQELYKIDAIQKERHSLGVPKASLPPGASKGDRTTAANMLRNIRTNEDAFILEPPGWVIDFAEIKGNVVDPMRSIDHHDQMIARAILVQFIVHSSSSGGSNRASGATEYDLFLKALRHIGNVIADNLNTYVIPRLVDYNYNVKRYPKLRVRRIGDNRDLQQLSATISNLVDCGAIVPDDALEEWLRDEIEAPGAQEMDQSLGDEAERSQIKLQLRKLTSVQLQENPEIAQAAPTNGGGRKPTGRTGKTGVVPNK